MTDNIKIIELPDVAGKIEQHIIIDHGNEQFTSMPKAVWDELEPQREQSGTL